MAVVIALLRAVNLGGHNLIKMEVLRRLCDSLGCEHVQAHITRCVPELRDIVNRNPFASRKSLDPKKLLVLFLAAEPAPECCDRLSAMNTQPEEVQLSKREVYMYFPNGMGRPKTSAAAIEKVLKVPGTGRNWKVVNDLLAIGEKPEAN